MKGNSWSRTVDLDSVGVGYDRISRAPHIADLCLKDPTGRLVEEEAQKKYKAVDRWGNVFLIQNPETWPTKKVNGMSYRCRPEPTLLMSSAAAEKESQHGPTTAAPDSVAPKKHANLEFGF